jgi:predicted lipoprotein with Yx(FWY)xxD motif
VRSSTKFLIPAVAASLALSACGSSSHSSRNSAASPTQPAAPTSSGGSSGLVRAASVSSLGTVLVNSQGLTLYRLSGEHAGNFICTSTTCLQAWHPLMAPGGSKPSGNAGSLGMVKRPNGGEQVTYKGMPLYTFAQDSAPGQANGQGIKDVGTWNAITTGATKASTPPATSTPAPASGGSGGSYGY